MDINLLVAGLKIKICNSPFSLENNRLEPFVQTFSDENIDICYVVHISDKEICDVGKCVKKDEHVTVYAKGDGIYAVRFSFYTSEGRVVCHTTFDYERKLAQIFVPAVFTKDEKNSGLFMALLAIDFVLLHFNRMMMHASIVNYQSEGIIFSGPSGIGKSTQSELWKRLKGAEILNGDRAIIDTCGKKVLAYGSPWAGSSEIYRNESVPVKAIVLLGQSKANHIKKLKGSDLYKSLIPRMSIAGWDEGLLSKCMDIVGKVIEKVPVYQLDCFVGKEAVDLLYETLYRS